MSAPGYQLPRDPTAVIGSRIGAWIVDALLVALVVVFLGPSPLNPFAEYHELSGGLDGWDACEILEDSDEAAACFPIGDRVYFTDGGVTALPILGLALYWLLVLGVLQGLTGWTPGKLLFGLRVVGEDGQRPGIGRALLRSLLWVVDAQPCGLPLVGFITGLTTTGHRRVGDMAAKTYVVHGNDVGGPIVVPGMTGQSTPQGYAGYPGYGTPTTYPSPGAYGAPPGAGHWGSAPAPPTAPSGPWGAPPGTPTTPPTEPRPAPPQAAAPAGPFAPERPAPPTEPTALPTSEAAESDPATPGPEVAVEPVAAPEAVEPEATDDKPAETEPTGPASGETPAVETEVVAVPETETPASPSIDVGPSSPPPEGTRPEYNPQWDAARGTYIQWDANRSRWLQWDDAAKEWKPI